MPASPIEPSPTSTSPSPRRSRPSTTHHRNCPPTLRAPRCASSSAEMHQRMLGNGYCARPVGLDCHFESICESCTFFQTTTEFLPTLKRQRDDAAAKGQVGRQRIFDGLLA